MKELRGAQGALALALCFVPCGRAVELHAFPPDLTRARDEVRRLVARGLDQDVTVYVHGGTYRLDRTLVLGLADSGTGAHKITWAAYPGDEPLISSGVPITGWTRVAEPPPALPPAARGRLWVADVPPPLGRFYSLYDVRGHLPRARSAGFIPLVPDEVQVKGEDPLRTLHFPKGALRNWPNLDDVELIIRPKVRWTMNILPLESVDESSGTARTKLPGTYPLRPIENEKRPTAWIENVLEALDEPGEWVLDTGARKLYLWPRGEKPEGILAPALRELIRVEGQVEPSGKTTPVRNLVFRGLTFAHADRDLWTKNDTGIQHDWEMIDKPDALLRFRGAERCTVEQCRFRDSGGNAVRLDLYAQENTIAGNEIRNLGQGGVILIGYGPGAIDVNRRNEIVNNHIHHSGLLYWHSHAIVLWQSGANRVAHNYIHHMPRKAICMSGVRLPYFQARCAARELCGSLRWAELKPAASWRETVPYLHTRDNVVENNEVANVLQMLGDGAAINVTGTGPGNVIRRNCVHDIFTQEFIGGCLRTDGWVEDTVWEENVVFRTNIAAWEHKGKQRVINNYAIDMSPSRYFRLYYDSVDGSVIERNIFYHPKGDAAFYTYKDPQQLARSTVGHNLYYAAGAPAGEVPKVLAELRAQGVGATDMFADPLFVDWQRGDFRLKPNSPAFKQGIKPIDLTNVGLPRDFPRRLME